MKDARLVLILVLCVATGALLVRAGRLRRENQRLDAALRRYAAAVPVVQPGAAPLRPAVRQTIARLRDALAQGQYDQLPSHLDRLVAEAGATSPVDDLGPEFVAAREFLMADPKARDRLLKLVTGARDKSKAGADVAKVKGALREALRAAAQDEAPQFDRHLKRAEAALNNAKSPNRKPGTRQQRAPLVRDRVLPPIPRAPLSQQPAARAQVERALDEARRLPPGEYRQQRPGLIKRLLEALQRPEVLPPPLTAEERVAAKLKELAKPYAMAQQLMIEGLDPVTMLMKRAKELAAAKQFEEADWLLESAAYLLGLRPLVLPEPTTATPAGSESGAGGDASAVTAEQVKPRLDLCQAMASARQLDGQSLYPADEFLSRATQRFDEQRYAECDWLVDVALSILGMSQVEIEALKQQEPDSAVEGENEDGAQ